VHSYATCDWELPQADDSPLPAPEITWATHGEPFVAAVENGPLWATQFHPEKSGDAGATLLRNWLSTLS
jgi:glutamine amidotransferase